MTFSPCSIVRFHHGGDGLHLRMDSHPATKTSHGLELALDHSLSWLGEPWHHAFQPFSHHIEVSPAHMESRVVGGLRRLRAVVLRQAECAVHSEDQLQLSWTRRWHIDGPVRSIAEGLMLAGQVIDAMADDEWPERIDRRLGLGCQAFSNDFGTPGRASGIEIIEGTAECAYWTMRRFASDQSQHSLQVIKTDAERASP